MVAIRLWKKGGRDGRGGGGEGGEIVCLFPHAFFFYLATRLKHREIGERKVCHFTNLDQVYNKLVTNQA